MTESRIERTDSPFLPATAKSKDLGDLPLGSIQSRAVARLMLQQRRSTEKRRHVVIVIDDLPESRIRASEWSGDGDGTLNRSVFVAAGVLLADAMRAVGGFSLAELEQAADEWPDPLEGFEILSIEG
jgi:hypothetical protein